MDILEIIKKILGVVLGIAMVIDGALETHVGTVHMSRCVFHCERL